jgi:hypothetical protein
MISGSIVYYYEREIGRKKEREKVIKLTSTMGWMRRERGVDYRL